MLAIITPTEQSSEAMDTHRLTDLRLFWLRVDCPARTLLGFTYTMSFCLR